LPVEEQVRMLKAQYDLIPHDPYRYKELKARGLVDENGFVAMGVQNALAMIKAEEEKPKWQRKVIDLAWYVKKKLGKGEGLVVAGFQGLGFCDRGRVDWWVSMLAPWLLLFLNERQGADLHQGFQSFSFHHVQ
jgi:hypothetical protein